MAKKIYNVTTADGNTQTVTTKKAVNQIEDIVRVEVNGEDVTAQFVKEDATMAQNEIIEAQATTTEYDEAVEAIEAVEEAQAEVEALEAVEEIEEAEEVEAIEEQAPAGPKDTILFIASRGKAKFLRWRRIQVEAADQTVKVKGCAALVTPEMAEVIGTNKFVAWVDQAAIERSVLEGKPIRGLASTVSDVFARYTKVTELTGADRVGTALEVFAEVLNEIDGGAIEGGWEREEPEAEEAPAEVDDANEVEVA